MFTTLPILFLLYNFVMFVVKPQPISAFKPAHPAPIVDHVAVETGSLKRPPRPPYVNRQNSGQSNSSSLSKDHLKMSLVSDDTCYI